MTLDKSCLLDQEETLQANDDEFLHQKLQEAVALHNQGTLTMAGDFIKV